MKSWSTILCAPLFAGCVVTDVGNPDIEASVHFEPATRTSALELGDGTSFDAIWMQFHRVRLIEEDACNDDAPVDFAEPVAVELLEARTIPDRVAFEQPQTGYCRLGMLFQPDAVVDGAPPELATSSLWMSGQRGDGTAIEVRAGFDDKLRLDLLDTLRPSEDVSLVVTFDTLTWFEDDAFTDADVTDATIVVSETQNTAIHDHLRTAVRRSAALFLDADRDGTRDEASAPIGEGVVE